MFKIFGLDLLFAFIFVSCAVFFVYQSSYLSADLLEHKPDLEDLLSGDASKLGSLQSGYQNYFSKLWLTIVFIVGVLYCSFAIIKYFQWNFVFGTKAKKSSFALFCLLLFILSYLFVSFFGFFSLFVLYFFYLFGVAYLYQSFSKSQAFYLCSLYFFWLFLILGVSLVGGIFHSFFESAIVGLFIMIFWIASFSAIKLGVKRFVALR